MECFAKTLKRKPRISALFAFLLRKLSCELIKEFLRNKVVVIAKSSHRRCSIKKMFLKIAQNSQKNTCARVAFFKNEASPATLLKKTSDTRVFL